jgi:hypothetical protein
MRGRALARHVVTVMALERKPRFELPLLVTLGSPLGASFLQERLNRDGDLAAWPGGVQRWVKVSAVGDRAHDVEPHLNASVTGAAIATAL